MANSSIYLPEYLRGKALLESFGSILDFVVEEFHEKNTRTLLGTYSLIGLDQDSPTSEWTLSRLEDLRVGPLEKVNNAVCRSPGIYGLRGTIEFLETRLRASGFNVKVFDNNVVVGAPEAFGISPLDTLFRAVLHYWGSGDLEILNEVLDHSSWVSIRWVKIEGLPPTGSEFSFDFDGNIVAPDSAQLLSSRAFEASTNEATTPREFPQEDEVWALDGNGDLMPQA